MLKLSSIQFAKLVDGMRSIASTGGSDKRQATRMEIQARIWIASMSAGVVVQSYTALSRDVSIAGLGLMQRSPSKLGDQFLASLPFDKENLVVLCKTMYCQSLAEGVFGIGAMFEKLAGPDLVEQMRTLRGDTANRIQHAILD